MWRGLVARFGEPHKKKFGFYSIPKLARLKQVTLLDREFIQDSENIYSCILIICRKQDILTILNMCVEYMQYP